LASTTSTVPTIPVETMAVGAVAAGKEFRVL
jgi:hypothetical protein